jgi:hypothetical protein
MEKIVGTDRYNHVFSSLMFCSHALLEYRTLSVKYELAAVNQVVRQAPFNFYRASLTYLLILEYCKLFNPREVGHKMSNLRALWIEAEEIYPQLKESRNTVNHQKLQMTETGTFLKQLKKLRNKTIAHSDYDPLNRPFNIRALVQTEIEVIAQDLDNAIEVFNLIAKQKDLTVLGFPHQSTGSSQTKNFIHTAAIARSFYDKNMSLAYKQGFHLWQQKIVPPRQ